MAFDPRYLSYVNKAPETVKSNQELARLQQAHGGRGLDEIKKSLEHELGSVKKNYEGWGPDPEQEKLQRLINLINNAPELAASEAAQRKEAEALQARAEGTASADQSALIKNAQQQNAQAMAQAMQVARAAPTATAAGAMRAMQRAKAAQTQMGSQNLNVARLSDMLAVRQQLGKEAFANEGIAIQSQMEADLAAAKQQQQMMGGLLQGFGSFLAGGGFKSSPFSNLSPSYTGAPTQTFTNTPVYSPTNLIDPRRYNA